MHYLSTDRNKLFVSFWYFTDYLGRSWANQEVCLQQVAAAMRKISLDK